MPPERTAPLPEVPEEMRRELFAAARAALQRPDVRSNELRNELIAIGDRHGFFEQDLIDLKLILPPTPTEERRRNAHTHPNRTRRTKATPRQR